MASTELGRTERALGHRDRASVAFDRAIGVLEELRTHVAGSERDSAAFFADRTEPYNERMSLAIEEGRPAEAFHYLERSRARALLDTMNGRRPPVSKTMTAEERTEERRLRLALNAVSQQIQAAEQPDEALRKRQDQARLDYEAFQTRLYVAHPELRVARAQTSQPSTPGKRRLLTAPPSANAALLEFAVAAERTRLFVITSRRAEIFRSDGFERNSSAARRAVSAATGESRSTRGTDGAHNSTLCYSQPASSRARGQDRRGSSHRTGRCGSCPFRPCNPNPDGS